MAKLKILVTILVLAISCFTHFYRIDQTYVFQNDEGRDALIALRMIDSGRPVLLGPETSVGNMYLGPFYYYMMVPSLYLSGLNPVGPAIMVALLGVITTYLIICLGKKYWSTWAGIFSALFYALSPVMLHYSRSSWNPNVLPFFIVLLLLVYEHKSRIFQLIFGLIVGIIFQLHYVALVVPALLLFRDLYFAWKKRRWSPFLIKVVLILLGFMITTLPFWLFEIRHSFVNSQAFITYLLDKSSRGDLGYPPYLNRLLSNSKLVVQGMMGSSSLYNGTIPLYVSIFSTLLVLAYLGFARGLLSYLLVFSLLVVSVLKESIHIHYLAFLFPIVSLMVGIALTKKNLLLKFLAALTILSLISPTISTLKYNLGVLESTQPKRAHETAEYINRESHGRPYNVVNSQGSYTTTISYYLAKSDNPPKQDLQNLIFDICIGGPCPESDETTVLLFLTGPAHPSISDYLGHPQLNEFNGRRKIVKNEWVTYDVWVATINLEP